MTTTILSSARLDGVDEWAPFLIYFAALLALVVGGSYLFWNKSNGYEDLLAGARRSRTAQSPPYCWPPSLPASSRQRPDKTSRNAPLATHFGASRTTTLKEKESTS